MDWQDLFFTSWKKIRKNQNLWGLLTAVSICLLEYIHRRTGNRAHPTTNRAWGNYSPPNVDNWGDPKNIYGF